MLAFKHWDLVEYFTVSQAASLWCDIEPGLDDNLIRVDHPEITAIDQLLYEAVERGELPATRRDFESRRVTRAELRSFAERKGARPKFLFPEERDRSQAKGLVAMEATQDNPTLSQIAATTNPTLEKDPPYRSPYVVLLLRAENEFREKIRDLKKSDLEAWFNDEGPKIDRRWSHSKAAQLATFLRHPDQQRGGPKRQIKV